MAISFSTTNGSTTVTVSDNESGAAVGDYVVFDEVSGLTGTNVATYIRNNGDPHRITKLNGTASYDIVLSTAADGNNTTAGQASAFYYLESGIEQAVLGPGWGAGTWSRSSWGSEINQVAGQTIRLWSVDSFGEDLLVNLYDGGLYYWYGNNTAERLQPLQSLGGLGPTDAAAVPTVSRFVLVSDVDRHVLCFGCNPYGSTEQDRLQIRWSDRENPFLWTPTSTNTSGDLRISQGVEITAVTQTRKEILVWTDRSLHTIQYTGQPFYFGQALIADNVRIAGANAVYSVNDTVYWMGTENFYMYNGRVQVLPCTVRSFVFDDLNKEQIQKIYAGALTTNHEIWWFYPSQGETENNRYVVYNYLENVWYVGSMGRTAFLDASSTVRIYPQGVGADNYLYSHERGLNDGSTDPASPLNAFIESSDFDIGEGDRFMLTQRLIPDLTFAGSTDENPSATFKLKARNFPGVSYSEEVSGNATRSAESPVEQFTDQIFLRTRGRAAAVRIESNDLGVQWKLGAPRLEMKPDGRR